MGKEGRRRAWENGRASVMVLRETYAWEHYGVVVTDR